MDDEGPSPNTGAARLVVLLCAFALATVGAFLAFFATDVLAVVIGREARPSTWVLVLCALIPTVSAVLAGAASVRAKRTGVILASGCGTLLLGALITIVVMLAVAL